MDGEPLITAVRNGDVRAVAALLEAGAEGRTALLHAVDRGLRAAARPALRGAVGPS
jgi:hypothetical protein